MILLILFLPVVSLDKRKCKETWLIWTFVPIGLENAMGFYTCQNSQRTLESFVHISVNLAVFYLATLLSYSSAIVSDSLSVKNVVW